MWKATVCSAKFDAFENAADDIAERMLVALEAAEGESGDIRGLDQATNLAQCL